MIYNSTGDWNGTDTFTYKASDGSLDSNTATVTITVAAVNDAPVTSGYEENQIYLQQKILTKILIYLHIQLM